MQRDRIVAARLWLANALTDLELAAEIAPRYAARSCFHAQQSAEMSLKAALIALADDHPRTHIAGSLVREIETLGETVSAEVALAANKLDLFYTGSRYPDALGGADPRKVLGETDARAAIVQAESVAEFARMVIDRIALG